MTLSKTIRIALIHFAPKTGDIAGNAAALEKTLREISRHGVDWVVTPELCLTGYDFVPSLGSDWIVRSEDDSRVTRFRALASELGIVLFLAHPERDDKTELCYNSILVLGRDGTILGRHRKFNTLRGAEGWSSKGTVAQPVALNGARVGLLVCADAYTSELADRLAAIEADILISSAAWAPWPHGPEGCWEKRSLETRLPLLVCNRTGQDRTLDFTLAETTIICKGEVLFSHRSEDTAAIIVDWDNETRQVLRHVRHAFERAAVS